MVAWFDRSAVVSAAARGEFGTVMRAAREAGGLSQQQTAQLLGCSRATVCRYETGAVRLGDVALLGRVARVLAIPPGLFGLSAADPPPGKLAGTPEEVRLMQRRHVLAGLAVSAAALPAWRAIATPLTGGLDRVLFYADAAAAPVPAPVLASRLQAGRVLFAACRWRELAAAMPPLIEAATASRAQATYDRVAAAQSLLAQVYVLANELAIKLHANPTACVLADRAVQAARAGGDPRVLAQAQWRMSISLRRSKHAASAAPLVTQAADDLKTATGLATPWDGGFYARMLCCAAYTQALAGRGGDAYALIDAARQVLAEHPRALFSTDGIDLYAISVARACGEFGQATGFARRIAVGGLADRERRTRFYEDAAIAWWGAGRPAQTYAALRAAEAIAPQEVALRPWAHRLTLNLLSCPARVGLSGLREFAVRIGVGGARL